MRYQNEVYIIVASTFHFKYTVFMQTPDDDPHLDQNT